MQKFIALLCVLLACCPVLAQDKSKAAGKNVSPPPKMTPAQKKQAIATACEKEGASLKLTGEPLRSFMRSCRGEPPPKMTPEQKKQAIAKACEKEGASLKLKDEPLKSFLKACLSPPAPLK